MGQTTSFKYFAFVISQLLFIRPFKFSCLPLNMHQLSNMNLKDPQMFQFWLRAWTGTLRVDNFLLTGTVPVNNCLLTEAVPVNN